MNDLIEIICLNLIKLAQVRILSSLFKSEKTFNLFEYRYIPIFEISLHEIHELFQKELSILVKDSMLVDSRC
jgi:hypothetical protein